jgi:hypothetical protein
MPRFRTPSPAMCVALLGLFVALGGTTWAATSLGRNTVGNEQLKSNAVTGPKVKDHSLTGIDIQLSRLGVVPTAARAAVAEQATHATTAEDSRHAITADSAGTAYSTFRETAGQLPSSLTTVASLKLPAGSYLLIAKGQVDTFNNSDIVECDLIAGTDKDKGFVQAGTVHQSQILTNTLVHTFIVAGTVDLACGTFGTAGSLSQIRVTAMSVGSIAPTQ